MSRATTALAWLRNHAASAVVAAVGLACALAAWRSVGEVVGAQQAARLREVAQIRSAALRDRLHAYAALLQGASGLIYVLGRDPDAEEFRAFVEALELSEQSPGLQGVGYSKLLLPVEVEGHEAAEREVGRRDYRVWPAGRRSVYTAIDQIEPLDWRNRRAIGFDMFAEPVRREAMERARDTGAVAASGKVDLAEEADEGRQAGFLMYIAVYRGAPRAAADQERLLRGWVFAPVRIGDLLDDLFDDEPGPAIGLSVYDAATPRPEALLQQDALSSQPPLAVHETRIDVGGRPWLLRFSAAPAFASRVSRALQPAVLALGLALTFLITWVTWREATARRRAERAGRRSAFLAEAGEVLASSLDYRRTLAQVAHLASERIADGCVIGLLEPEGPFWITAHADPELALRLAQALRAEGLGPEARVGMAAALRTRTPIVVHDLAASVPPRRSLALGAELREESVTAALSVPLLARDEPLGGVTLLATSPGARFDTADAALAEDLARFAVAAVDTARLYRRAQEAVDARDEFLSVASHELRTPLSSLALQSESLRISAHRLQDEGLAARAELLRRNVDRLAWLVATLLDISRITAGRLEVELEDVDLAQLARDVVQRFEEEARRASCHLVVDAPAPVLGRWDRLRLDQVITNLLSNAIKYGPGEPVEVKVAAGQGRAVLAVRDHGIGIASIDQPRIFERFERAAPKTAKRDYGGFGLGLWIVRRVVEALGGTVRVESTLGEGSTFIVELVSTPISPPRAAPPGVASDAAARGGG